MKTSFLAIIQFKDSGNVQVKSCSTFDSAVDYLRERIKIFQTCFYQCCEINLDNLADDLEFESEIDSGIAKFFITEDEIDNYEDCVEIK